MGVDMSDENKVVSVRIDAGLLVELESLCQGTRMTKAMLFNAALKHLLSLSKKERSRVVMDYLTARPEELP